MKIKIMSIKNSDGKIVVVVNHLFGSETFRFDESKAEPNFITGEPKWMKELRQRIRDKHEDKKTPTNQELVNSEIEI